MCCIHRNTNTLQNLENKVMKELSTKSVLNTQGIQVIDQKGVVFTHPCVETIYALYS